MPLLHLYAFVAYYRVNYIYIYIIYYSVFVDCLVKSSMIRVVARGGREVFEWYGRPGQQS